MEELEAIVQRMIDAGESEDNIKLVIEEYTQNVEKTNGSQKEDATVEPVDMASRQDATSLVSPKFQNVTIDIPDLTQEEFEAIVNVESQADDQRKKDAAEKTKQYKRQLKIEEITGIKPEDYPSLTIDEEDQSYMGRVVKVPVQEKVNMDKMENIISDVSSEFMDQFAPMLSNEFKALENYQSDPMKYADELKEIENKAYTNISKKYPGLSKKDFTDIANIGGSGLFQNALDKQANTYNSKANQANLKGAETLDEDFYKSVIANEDSSRNTKELQKKELVENIIQKTRELQTTQEGPRARFLRFEIAQHKDDIQKLATTKERIGYDPKDLTYRDVVDPTLASSYFENETTKYRRDKIREAQESFEGIKDLGLEQIKSSEPTMTDLQAIEKFLKSKAYELQQLQVAGNEETISVDIAKSAGTRLYRDLKSMGLVKDGQTGSVDVPIKTIFDLGFDGRDFEPDEKYLLGSFDVMKDAMSEDDRLKLLNYEDAIYRTKGEISSLYDLRYLNNDPETLDRGGGVKSFLETTVKAVATHYTDLRIEEADKFAAMGKNETTAATLEKFEAIVPDFNETFKKEIANGEIDELGFTKEQMQAIEKTFGEEIGEGVGHFVPMLIDLGVLSAGTGMVMSIPKIASAMATLRGGTAFQKAQFHAIAAMIEEGKMFTVGMGAGTGAGFYAGGQLTTGVSPFKGRFKYFDPVWQRVVKGGVVGASSSQLATVMENGVKDLMGDADFKAAIDQHFGHLTTRDFIVESIVFSIVGASHLRKKDFMSTSGKYKALDELNKELREVMPEGGIEKMTSEQKEKYGALLSAKNVIEQQIQVETNAVELDPNSKNFEKNYNARIVRPTENAVRQVIPEYKGFDVRFVEGKGELAEGNTAEFRYKEGKDGKDLIILDKNAYTPGKTAHELTHLVTENYFRRNPEAEVKFTKKMETLFKDFNFEAFEGTPLAEFIKEGYKIDAKTKEGRSEAAREYLAYMTELLSDPKIYYQKIAPTFFKEAKQELLSIVEENFGYRPKVRNAKEFVELLGRFAKDQRMALGFEMKAARLADLEEFDFLGIEFVENNKKKEKATFASQDLTKKRFLIEKEKLDASDMYRLDKRLFDEAGNSKHKPTLKKGEPGYEAEAAKIKEQYQSSSEFREISDVIQRELQAPKGGLYKLIEKEADAAGITFNRQGFIEAVKDNLIIREYNFNPAEGGGSLYGYYSGIAIPREATRAREAFIKRAETGEGVKRVELDKDVSEGRAKFEIEAEKSYFEKDFENEDVGIAAQIRYRDYLKEAGLKESEAEAYMPTGKGMDVAKKLQIEVPEIDLSQPDIAAAINAPQTVKEGLSYKNLRKTSNEITGNTVALEYFNLNPELWSIIKTTPAKNLNIPARQAIKDKLKENVETHIKLLPQGAQDLITRQGENVTPEFLKNTSTGTRKKLLEIPMLYTKKSRTGKNLAEFVKTPELIKYEKLVDPKQGTPEFEFKQGFENKFLEFFEGQGREKDQLLKGIVFETIDAIHNQSVRKALNAIGAGKEVINQAASGKSSAIASKVLDNYFVRFPEQSFEQAQEAFYRAYLGDVKNLSKEQAQYFKNIGLEPGLMTREQALTYGYMDAMAMAGKSKQVRFDKDLQIAEIKDITLETGEVVSAAEIKGLDLSANFSVKKGDVIVNVNRTNNFVDHSVEFAKLLPKEIAQNLSFFDQILFLHQRTTFEKEARDVKKSGGKIIDQSGNSIVGQPFTKGRSRALEGLGENTIKEIWEGIGFDFKKATSQVTGQKKYAEAKTEAERIAIIEKFFNQFSESNKIKIYNGIASTMEAYVHSGRNKAEVLSRMEWAANAMRSNSNLRLGLRQTAPIFAIYKGTGLMTPEQFKLEHAKTSVKQSLTTFELISQNKWREYGAETLKDFVGVLAPKKLLDIIDAKGGTTNMEALYRMAILEPKTLSEFVTVESNGKQTLLDYMLKKGKAEIEAKAVKEATLQEMMLKTERKKLKDVGLLSDVNMGKSMAAKSLKNHDKAIIQAREKNKTSRGMSTFDFDETLIVGGKNFVTATRGKESIKISSEQFPLQGPRLAEQGYKFDFKDFVNVKGGKEGPLMQKLKNQIEKYGTDNVFILTARMQEAAPAIQAWLKTQGVNLPIKNITGLGNSTGEAKALWMLEKFSEGYNDMYFVDDALPNVKAVKRVLDQLDIKSDVQQAMASKNLNKEVNDIMQYSLGIGSSKVFSKAEGKVRGKDIKRRRFFMPDTASDLELLLEPLYGKGKKGIENKKWFEENFIRKWERGINDFNNARQAVTNDYLTLRKKNKDVVKQLPEAVEGTNFTHDMAMRVYIWNKNGYTIPDLAPATQKKLVSYIINNPKLQAYAESVARLTKVEGGLKEPSAEWWGETIASEIQGLGEGIGRKKYIQDFIDSKNEIFSEANLNKMESKLGGNWRETIEDMFDRMETGRTRSMKLGKTGTAIMNYLNGSTGAIMNFNTRSAFLQLISTVNFVNSSFNNPLRAGQAFANQPQYWKDFMFIMNSDMLKQRRQGLQINVTEAELASAASKSKNPAKAALAKILKAGYLPTKVADSFAIAAGGATYYRNAIRKYTKEGLSKAEAERKAFIDFQAIAERTQQSSRADLLSKQQTSLEGRLILPFANTPMQMNRIMIKDMLDLSKGRYKGFYGENSLTSKLSRIGYYGFVQSLIFAGLQSGAFALMTNSYDDEKVAESKVNALNTVADSFLRGMGIQGAILNGVRLSIQEFIKQDGKKHNADYSEVAEKLLNISPTVGSKFSKLDAAGNTYKYNKKVVKEEGLTLNGPLLEASTQVIEATTNVPLNRFYKKGNNIQNALDDSYYNWQRVLMGAGWSSWGLGPGKDEERTVIVNKGKENEYTRYLTKEQLRREKVEKGVKQKEKKEKKARQQQCTKIKSDGRRCKIMVNKPKSRCHYHD